MQEVLGQLSLRKVFGAFWCKKKGLKKSDCGKFKAWLENKQKLGGNNLAFVYLESNLVDVPIDSWWLDNGSTTHIVVSFQGFKILRDYSLKGKQVKGRKQS